MRLNFERDLIVRTSRGSLFHFWMLLFCNDRLLDLRRISCSVQLFFRTKTLPLKNSQCRLISIMKYHSCFETLIWLIKSSAGKMSDFTKRSVDPSNLSHIANRNSPIDLSINSLHWREIRVLKKQSTEC